MEQLISFIIRPPRAEYNPENDLLHQEFMLKGKWYKRKDLEVVNSRGGILQCSHYMPIICPEGNPLPCLIYCHGNSGCRTDANEAAIMLLPSNITVFTLDFSGSGLSGGEHVTLGWNEKDDLKAVVDYLRADGNVSLIGLWGRSMGAVTSLMYGAEDPSIAGMVLDSPFSDLVDLMMELVDTYGVRLPKFTVKFAIQYMRRAIQKKAKFDITDLNAIKVARSCFVPVLFGHANGDDFIQPHHSDRIFDAYMGDKNIIKFEGDHNSLRPQFYFDSISIFFNNVLHPPEDEVGSTFFDNHDYISEGSWSTGHDLEYPDELLGSHTGSGTSSTENINLLRSKRPMSVTLAPADISSEDKLHDDQVESSGSDSHASSSNMINFELSSAGAHVPASIDDGEFVEYSLDTLADFPSNTEEEERMLMEAVLVSLKDLDTTHPQVEEPSSDSSIYLEPKPASKNGLEDSFSTQSDSNSAANEPKLASQMLPPDQNKESGNQGISLPTDPSTGNHNIPDADIKNHSNETSILFKNPISNDSTAHHTEETSEASSLTDQSASEADKANHTKITVKVVKNPTNNIMDGLLRRWDLNFFRNR